MEPTASPTVTASAVGAASGPDDDVRLRGTWTRLLGKLEVARLDARHALASERSAPILDLLPPHRPGILTFWATYCPPCIDEMPLFNALHAEGAAVAGISMDASNSARVREILDREKVAYPAGILTHAALKLAGRALDDGLPFTIIVDREHEAHAIFRGAVTKDTLRIAFDRAARER